MKIGLVCPYNVFSAGGVQEVVKALQKGLGNHGHKVWIITPRPQGYKKSAPPGTIFLGVARRIEALHTTSQISLSLDPHEIEKVLNQYKFDILHFHEPAVPMLSRQVLAHSKAVNIGTFHAKLPDGIIAGTIEKIITPHTNAVIKKLDALVAVSDPAAEFVRSLTNKSVRIIPNGIDLNKFRAKSLESRIKKEQKTILYVGRLEKRKGVGYLLKALGALQKKLPNIALVVAGDGPLRAKLQKYALDNQIKHVSFLGFVSERRKLELMCEADLFCSPAIHGESFGIVLLEAMACGVPVVAGDNPGYASVLTGIARKSLVDPKDIRGFCKKIDLFLYDYKLREQWQKWARSEVGQYDYPKVVREYEQLYNKTLASQGR